MWTKNFKENILLWIYEFNDKLSLCITKWTLSDYDIKVNYKDLNDSDYWKTPKHIHWIFDIMIKKEHKSEEVKSFMRFLLNKWNTLTSDFCSAELIKLHNKEKTLEELFNGISDDISNYTESDIYWYFPNSFLILFWYLMVLQEKNNRSDAYMFKNMLEWVINDEYNPYKIISIATWKYSR